MPVEQRPIARLTYVLPEHLITAPPIEQHRHNAITGLNLVTNLGKLLTTAEVNFDDEPNNICRNAMSLLEGVQAAGEVLAIIADSIYTEIEALADQEPAQA